jgi:hypothetical protein
MFSDAAIKVVHLDLLLPKLPPSLIVLTGPKLRAAAVVVNGQLIDAVWVDDQSKAAGEGAAMAIMGAREGTVSGYRLEDSKVAEAVTMLWRCPERYGNLSLDWLNVDKFLDSLAGERRDCALVVSGPEPGVALFMAGELVGVYSMSHRQPAVAMDRVRQLLTGSGTLSILQRAGDKPVGRTLQESDYHVVTLPEPVAEEPQVSFETAATEMVPEHAADFNPDPPAHEPAADLPLPAWMTPATETVEPEPVAGNGSPVVAEPEPPVFVPEPQPAPQPEPEIAAAAPEPAVPYAPEPVAPAAPEVPAAYEPPPYEPPAYEPPAYVEPTPDPTAPDIAHPPFPGPNDPAPWLQQAEPASPAFERYTPGGGDPSPPPQHQPEPPLHPGFGTPGLGQFAAHGAPQDAPQAPEMAPPPAAWQPAAPAEPANEGYFANFSGAPQHDGGAPAAPDDPANVEFDTIRNDLIQIGVLWLGDKDVSRVAEMIRTTTPTVESFVHTIEEIKGLTVEGHDPSVIRAMAREMQYHAAEFLSGA